MDLITAQGQISASSRLYMMFTATHPTDGSLTFYFGDQSFMAANTSESARVYPVVSEWGALRQYLAEGGRDRDTDVVVDIVANAYATPTGNSIKYRIDDLIRRLNLHEVAVSIYQWNSLSLQYVIIGGAVQPASGDDPAGLVWSGYWYGIDRFTFERGRAIVSIRLKARQRTLSNAASLVIDKTTYPDAPQDSIGRMVARAYGDFTTAFDLVGGSDIAPVCFGYGGRYVPGIDVDDSVGTASATVIFCKNDGSTGALQVTEPTADQPDGDFFVYVPEAGTYASIYRDISTQYIFAINDSVNVRATVNRTPKAMVYFRPIENGSTTTLGVTLYKAIDDDPTNYVETTAASFIIAWKCPILSFLGGRIINVRIVLDHWHDTASVGHRDPKFGLWDVVAGTWLNSKFDQSATSVRRKQIITAIGSVYTAADLSTRAEFSEGRFITRDASGNEKPLELRIEPDTNLGASGKDKYRLYSAALVCTVEMPTKSIEVKKIRRIVPFGFDPKERLEPPIELSEIITPADSVSGTQFLFGGKAQKDDASGTYTGTASALIQKAPDITRHLLQKIGSYSVNASSGTLGNFVDARTEAVAKELHLAPYFGIDERSIQDVLVDIQRRWPMRLSETDGVWNAILDEMNPHSSRMYRSASDPIKISARRDLLEDGFSVSEIQPEEIVNNVQLNYAHAYGTNRPGGVTTYSNPLSAESFYYGLRQLVTVDEPWIPRNDLVNESPHPSATYIAKWLGRRAARPRLTVRCRLGQRFFDLKRGHILEFSEDMEDAGIECPAYRCGLFDYIYVSASDTTNYANSSVPKFVAASGSGEAYFMASQQYQSITFRVATPAGYTTVANGWEYYDTSWIALVGVVNADAMKSTGKQTVSWTRPTLTSWKKSELSLAGTTKGHGYPVRMKYASATAQGLGNALTTYPAKWNGRLFEAIEVTRKPGGLGSYPYVEIVLQEVM